MYTLKIDGKHTFNTTFETLEDAQGWVGILKRHGAKTVGLYCGKKFLRYL